jgi:N-acetylmuramoyl-L-alanine amidase
LPPGTKRRRVPSDPKPRWRLRRACDAARRAPLTTVGCGLPRVLRSGELIAAARSPKSAPPPSRRRTWPSRPLRCADEPLPRQRSRKPRRPSEATAANGADCLDGEPEGRPPLQKSERRLFDRPQLGLGVSRIVIDPGHGGHDPGAMGKGVTEAELVLDVALRLEQLLLKQQGVEVILTRRTDEFIPLPERTAIANREGADLFLSIHANASANAQARGIETYFLNFANNLSAAAVAARENAASAQLMGALPDFVKAIALNNKLDESRDFATYVQQSMVARLRGTNKTLRNLGVKQAPFVVLIGAAMPSVLAEISFVTNPQEARAAEGECLPAANCGGAVQRDPQVPGVVEERHRGRAAVRKGFGRPTSASAPRTSRPPSAHRAAARQA